MGRSALLLIGLVFACDGTRPELRIVEASYDHDLLEQQCVTRAGGGGQGFTLFQRTPGSGAPPRSSLAECAFSSETTPELAAYLACWADDLEARNACVALRSCAERWAELPCPELPLPDCGAPPPDYERWSCTTQRCLRGIGGRRLDPNEPTCE